MAGAEPFAGQERMHVTTRPIADPVELLARLPIADPVAWVREGEGLIGWGVAARLEVRGNERFSRTQRWWSTLCSSLEVDDTVSMPGTGPVAFGSFSFDADAGSSIVVVPKVIVGRRAGQAWMTVIGTEPGARPSLPPVSVPAEPHSVTWAEGSTSAIEWQAAVAEAVSRIKAGELDKVVLARDVIGHVTGPLDVRHLLLRLARSYPSCWTFCVGDMIGATPELLVRRTGDLVTSRVLAGTVRRRGDERTDASLARALMASGKDTEEHEYAVHSVARALAAHCTDLDVPPRPHVLELANVQHLATDVTGRLADAAPVLALAASLHPTAAVCGTPTERAFSVIREIEGMDRGRYAGPVGWFDRHGDGEFGIALRCASVDADAGQLRSYAGCGIVAGSDPADELAESVAKLVPIRDALEGRDRGVSAASPADTGP
jgi:menaquinone-specific isochorismate synthase